MKLPNFLKKKYVSDILFFTLLTLVSSVCYLIFAKTFSFFQDDWYLIYAAVTQGVEKFSEIFIIDRPFRALFTSLIFNLFGLNAPLYSYLAWLVRLLGAFSFYWLLRMVWPQQKYVAQVASLLLVVYPGFLDQPNAFDYQAHIWAFSLGLLSIALTVKALLTQTLLQRILLTLLSIVSGGLYLFLIEYNIGLEVLRLILVWYILWDESWKRRFVRTISHWMPFALAPLGFMIWRLFIFENQRQTTDIWGMFSGLTANPLHRGLWFIVRLLQDTLNEILFAWAVPVYQVAFNLRLRDAIIMLTITFSIIFLVTLCLRFWQKDSICDQQKNTKSHWGKDMFWIGLLSVMGSLIPIILGDRHVIFSGFSRFTLPGSAGAIMVICGLLFYYTKENVRVWLPALLLGLALMTHFANGKVHMEIADDLRNFWWQVSWRVPQIESGTTLAVDYAQASVSEDYWAWGPANLIYYPEYLPKEPTQIDLGAVVLNNDTILAALQQRDLGVRERRGLYSNQDLSNFLVLTQPSTYSCVHVIDGTLPELSSSATPAIHVIAGSSKIEKVLVDETPRLPDARIFGKEPPHDWCYYYQKASLARQGGNWDEILRLSREAEQEGLRPLDWVEWTPFLQAFAYTGEFEKVRAIVPLIKDDKFLHYQTCQLLSSDQKIDSLYQDEHESLLEILCN